MPHRRTKISQVICLHLAICVQFWPSVYVNNMYNLYFPRFFALWCGGNQFWSPLELLWSDAAEGSMAALKEEEFRLRLAAKKIHFTAYGGRRKTSRVWQKYRE